MRGTETSGGGRAIVGLIVLASIVAATAGVGVGALAFAPAVPETLREAAPVRSAPVGQRSFDDKRKVEVTLTPRTDTALRAQGPGRITSLSCQAGTSFESGRSNLSIDGLPSVNLATAVPLWRDLGVGDRGDDVRALQTELARLGQAVAVDGTVGRVTLRAVGALLGAEAAGLDSVPVSRIVWLPAPSVVVSSCAVSTGDSIAVGDPIAGLSGGLAAAAITRLPAGRVPGSRVLLLDGERFPVDSSGAVTSAEGLSGIAASASYAEVLRSSATSITASYALAEPVAVSVVPPGALYRLDGRSACVLPADGRPRAVEVIGSELGQSFVTFASGSAPARIQLSPEGAPACG